MNLPSKSLFLSLFFFYFLQNSIIYGNNEIIDLSDAFAMHTQILKFSDLPNYKQNRYKMLQEIIHFAKNSIGEDYPDDDILITPNYFIYSLNGFYFFDNYTMPKLLPNPFPTKFSNKEEFEEFAIMKNIKKREFLAFLNLKNVNEDIKQLTYFSDKWALDLYKLIQCLLQNKTIEEQNKNLENLKKSGIAWLASIYKIHLHIKPKYINDFACKFADSIHKNKDLLEINLFKFLKDWNKAKTGLPFVVVYLPKGYYPDQTERYNFLDKYIIWFQNFFDEWITELALKYPAVKKLEDIASNEHPPRYSFKINDVIFLAGGDGDSKEQWRSYYSSAQDQNERIVYTDDFYFIRGFEYKPISER